MSSQCFSLLLNAVLVIVDSSQLLAVFVADQAIGYLDTWIDAPRILFQMLLRTRSSMPGEAEAAGQNVALSLPAPGELVWAKVSVDRPHSWALLRGRFCKDPVAKWLPCLKVA